MHTYCIDFKASVAKNYKWFYSAFKIFKKIINTPWGGYDHSEPENHKICDQIFDLPTKGWNTIKFVLYVYIVVIKENSNITVIYRLALDSHNNIVFTTIL